MGNGTVNPVRVLCHPCINARFVWFATLETKADNANLIIRIVAIDDKILDQRPARIADTRVANATFMAGTHHSTVNDEIVVIPRLASD